MKEFTETEMESMVVISSMLPDRRDDARRLIKKAGEIFQQLIPGETYGLTGFSAYRSSVKINYGQYRVKVLLEKMGCKIQRWGGDGGGAAPLTITREIKTCKI